MITTSPITTGNSMVSAENLDIWTHLFERLS